MTNEELDIDKIKQMYEAAAGNTIERHRLSYVAFTVTGILLGRVGSCKLVAGATIQEMSDGLFSYRFIDSNCHLYSAGYPGHCYSSPGNLDK